MPRNTLLNTVRSNIIVCLYSVIFLTAVPARIQGIENKRFFNTDENQQTLERQDPKLQTWMTKTYF